MNDYKDNGLKYDELQKPFFEERNISLRRWLLQGLLYLSNHRPLRRYRTSFVASDALLGMQLSFGTLLQSLHELQQLGWVVKGRHSSVSSHLTRRTRS